MGAEWFADCARVLRPGGVLMMNTADEPDLRHVARVHAGLARSLPHTLAVAQVDIWKKRRFGNLVLAASREPFDLDTVVRNVAKTAFPSRVRHGPELARMLGSAQPFTDADASPDPGAAHPRRRVAGALSGSAPVRMGRVTTLPPPRTPDPSTAPALRWGVLAPGGIARSFAGALRAGTTQQVARRGLPQPRARRVVRATSSVPPRPTAPTTSSSRTRTSTSCTWRRRTPSTTRRRPLAIEAGKPVLVEKAFTRNAAEAREVVESARDRRRFRDGGDVDALPAPHRRRPALPRGRAAG